GSGSIVTRGRFAGGAVATAARRRRAAGIVPGFYPPTKLSPRKPAMLGSQGHGSTAERNGLAVGAPRRSGFRSARAGFTPARAECRWKSPTEDAEFRHPKGAALESRGSARRSGFRSARAGFTPARAECRWRCPTEDAEFRRPKGAAFRLMKIAIDARKRRDYGIGTYVRNVVGHLARLDRETTYFLFCDRSDESTLRDLAENFVPVVEDSAGYSL